MHRPSQSLSALSGCLGREEENIPLSSYVRHSHSRNVSLSSSISASSANSDSLKRKRDQGFSVKTEMVAVEEDDDSASEDEYQDDCGSYEEDESDEYDEDSNRRRRALAKGRLNKKRRVSSDVDAEGELDPYTFPPNSGSTRSSPLAHRSQAPLDHGASIKVTQLIPIYKHSKSCPHCNFVPANGRFSDLKRHHQKHLVDTSDDKERWVCLCCGDVRQDIDGKVEYIPHGNAKLTRYTRKDSAKRHWKRAHGVKGMIWDEAIVCTVDRVRGEDNWEVSGPGY